MSEFSEFNNFSTFKKDYIYKEFPEKTSNRYIVILCKGQQIAGAGAVMFIELMRVNFSGRGEIFARDFTYVGGVYKTFVEIGPAADYPEYLL